MLACATQGLRAMHKRMDAALAAAGAARAQNGVARPSRGSRTSVSGPGGRRVSTAPGPSASPLAGDKELFASLVPLIQACLLWRSSDGICWVSSRMPRAREHLPLALSSTTANSSNPGWC